MSMEIDIGFPTEQQASEKTAWMLRSLLEPA